MKLYKILSTNINKINKELNYNDHEINFIYIKNF